MSSSRDFGVEQFFRADEFRADDPSPKLYCKILKFTRYLHSYGVIYNIYKTLKKKDSKNVRTFCIDGLGHNHLLKIRLLETIF